MFELNKSSVLNIINNFNKAKILVIGDFAIDEMIYGQTARISREAPVLILKHTHTNIILGAASNAAHNISTLNSGQVTAIGTYGNDYHGPILLNTLKEANIDTSLMVMDENRATTTKTRISGASTQSVTQQIVRIDREVTELLDKESESKIIDNIIKTIPEYDGIILSDYGIGIITPAVIDIAIETARKHNKFIAVDTQKSLHRFKKATVLTPNQPDAEAFVGYEITDEKSLMQAGQDMLDQTEAEMVLLTRGGDGMMLFERSGKVHQIPAFNKTSVFDVTGAGDTVVASFLLALCCGANGFEAAVLGNLAASIVIRRFGCSTTSPNELKENLEKLCLKDLSIKI